MKKTIFILFLLFIINVGVCKAQGFININPAPELPKYSAEKIAEFFRKANEVPLKDPKGIPVKVRSYCLCKNRTKSGYKVHSGVLASDSTYKMGTKARLFYKGTDLGIFTFLDGGDRNIRGNNLDMWMADPTCRASRMFGIRNMTMQIVHVPEEEVRLYKKRNVVKSRVK